MGSRCSTVLRGGVRLFLGLLQLKHLRLHTGVDPRMSTLPWACARRNRDSCTLRGMEGLDPSMRVQCAPSQGEPSPGARVAGPPSSSSHSAHSSPWPYSQLPLRLACALAPYAATPALASQDSPRPQALKAASHSSCPVCWGRAHTEVPKQICAQWVPHRTR